MIARVLLLASHSFLPSAHAAPARIVSLNPAATELLFDFDQGKNIVGASEWSDYPEDAKKIPRVGSYLHPSFEQIAKLNPTLLVYSKEGEDSISSSLEKIHANAVGLPSRSLADFPKAVSELGAALSAPDRAQIVLKKWNAAWATIKAWQDKRILIVLDTQPLIVAGNDAFLSEAFERCGLHNVIKDLKGYPRISRETAHALHPQLTLFIQHATSNAKTNFDTALPSVTLQDAELGRLSLRLPQAIARACDKVAVAR